MVYSYVIEKLSIIFKILAFASILCIIVYGNKAFNNMKAIYDNGIGNNINLWSTASTLDTTDRTYNDIISFQYNVLNTFISFIVALTFILFIIAIKTHPR